MAKQGPGTDSPVNTRGMGPRQLQREARRRALLALDTLSSIMASNGQDAVRLAAAREILDRGFGRSGVGEAKRATPPAEDGFRVVVRQFTDERDDEPAAATEDGA